MMSDNIFADLGLPDAEELNLKTDLALLVIKMIRLSDLSQTEVALISGWTQPKVSALMNGRLDDISIEKLFRVAFALRHGYRITFDETPVPKEERPVARVEFAKRELIAV